MYDPLETSISNSELSTITKAFREAGINFAVIGGWATVFHVNSLYKGAFGREYMGSRDIDIFFSKEHDKIVLDVIKNLGFEKNGMPFRWEKIYDINERRFISEEESKNKNAFDLIPIFLDLFSDSPSDILQTWCDLDPLKCARMIKVNDCETVDIETLIELKCIAMASRNKADKENKDACDLYAILEYCGNDINKTDNLIRAINRMIDRADLSYSIAQHVLLDSGKQNLVVNSLQRKLKSLQENGIIKPQF